MGERGLEEKRGLQPACEGYEARGKRICHQCQTRRGKTKSVTSLGIDMKT